MKSRVSWSYESNELLDVVESFLHNIVTPCPQLCGRHTGGLHHPLSFAIWQRNAAALLIIIKLLIKNFDYPEKPLKYKHIRRISD